MSAKTGDASIGSAAEVKVLRCPGCGGDVKSTGSGPSWMNSDQWDLVKAGDYHCSGSCPNPGLKYFSRDDVERASFCVDGEVTP